MRTGYDIERVARIQQLRAVFQRHAARAGGPDYVLSSEGVQRAAWEFNVYPAKSQIWELHVCLGNRGDCVGLRFHEFCLLITFLQNLKKSNLPSQRRRERVRRVEDDRWDVFLGGSCNPTTWRADDAIPFFKKKQISFFNPQVAEWSPQLVAIEAIAKECSRVNLFVLDLRTRGIASMVELGYLSGANYNLVTVLPKKVAKHLVIKDENLSEDETDGLQRAILFLSDLLERRGYPLFYDLQTAMNCVQKMTKFEGRNVMDLSEVDGAIPVHDSEFDIGILGALLLETFQSYAIEGSKKVTAADAEAILRIMIGRAVSLQKSCASFFSFPMLCLLYAVHANPDSGAVTCSGNWLARLFSPLTRLASWLVQPTCPTYRPPAGPRRRYDVFLGGSCGDSTWRDELVIPQLRAAGVSFYNPQCSLWSYRMLPIEAKARELTRVLLFVITRETLSVACLVEAAHFIGQGLCVVLFVEPLEGSCCGGADSPSRLALSSAGLKDYNRGRTYLLDIASRANVPVAHSIQEAVDQVLALVKRFEAFP